MVGFVIDGIGKKNKPVINEQKNSIVNDVKKEIKTDEVVANEDNFMGIKKMLSYQNNVYGIEFQYPTSWSADMMMTKLKPNSQEDCKNSDCQMAVSVSVIKNEEKLTLKQYLDKNLEIYKNVKEVKVGDAVAYTATVVDSATSSENVAFIVQANDGNFFKLQGIALAGGEKEVLNQMISSFKFIEPVK